MKREKAAYYEEYENPCDGDMHPLVQEVRDYAVSHSESSVCHGVEHWDRVYRNGRKLLTQEVDSLVVGLFAYLHDVCRESDSSDLHHGERASILVGQLRDTLLKDLSDVQINLLKEACRLHTVKHKTGDPTIDACFDADRLDLGRVGVTPDPERLATEIGKRLAINSVRKGQMRVFEVLFSK